MGPLLALLKQHASAFSMVSYIATQVITQHHNGQRYLNQDDYESIITDCIISMRIFEHILLPSEPVTCIDKYDLIELVQEYEINPLCIVDVLMEFIGHTFAIVRSHGQDYLVQSWVLEYPLEIRPIKDIKEFWARLSKEYKKLFHSLVLTGEVLSTQFKFYRSSAIQMDNVRRIVSAAREVFATTYKISPHTLQAQLEMNNLWTTLSTQPNKLLI